MTLKQRTIFEYICQYQEKECNFPSIQFTADYFGLSKKTVKQHIDIIVRDGYLEKTDKGKLKYTEKGYKEYYE